MSEDLVPAPADPLSSCRAIENLIAAYAELVDDGDFAGLGRLQMFRDMLIVYDDGTPRTKHVTTNVVIDVDEEEAGTAGTRAYFTVLQALPGLPLQPIVSGRYRDRFDRRDGQWRFAERRVRIDLVGDLSRHLRRPQ